MWLGRRRGPWSYGGCLQASLIAAEASVLLWLRAWVAHVHMAEKEVDTGSPCFFYFFFRNRVAYVIRRRRRLIRVAFIFFEIPLHMAFFITNFLQVFNKSN
jgi:hypothetical protein